MDDQNAPKSFESPINYHRRRLEELKAIRKPWESAWQEMADFIEPTRLRLMPRNEGALKRDKIIDSSATFALRTLASGMHSGITSPARPWFRLITTDPELADFAPVKTYLAQVENRMREVFQSSNLYNAFHLGYGDLGLFGQSCALLVEDDKETIRCQQLLHGQFWLARDEKGEATTLYRNFRWSAQRIIERFGLNKVSDKIRRCYDNGDYDKMFDICHAIEPRLQRDPTRKDKRHKPYLSNYWKAESSNNQLLEMSGFDENPIIAPAWELAGDDHYAASPAFVALGDIKMLQQEQRRKLEAIDKLVRPPMTAPASMRNNPASLLPGSITYVDDPTGNAYRPAMEVRLSLSELAADIDETRHRIERAFYADLFLMLANMDGIQPRNQFEIAERKEEKLLALGPVLENIYNDQLEPVIERSFAILERRRELPEAPPELQNGELKIEYISMLAQAQKAVATGAIERGMAFAENLAGVKPDVLDKINADEALSQYFDMLGAPPAILYSSEDVQKNRQAKADAMAEQQQAEQMTKAAPAIKEGAQAANLLAEAADRNSGGALLQSLGIG